MTISREVFGPEPEGATPLTEEDFVGLKPTWVSNRADLDQAEADNIERAMEKHLRRPLKSELILDHLFVKRLHKDMFSNVWKWAGTYRQKETSIGVDPQIIQQSVYTLMEDARFWLSPGNSLDIDQVACQIHHKLVQIHPFPNGNGRLTRLFADLLLASQGRPAFSWGSSILGRSGQRREDYIAALRQADRGDLSALMKLARSEWID